MMTAQELISAYDLLLSECAGDDDLEGFAKFYQDFGYENLEEVIEAYRNCFGQADDLMELIGRLRDGE